MGVGAGAAEQSMALIKFRYRASKEGVFYLMDGYKTKIEDAVSTVPKRDDVSTPSF